MMSFIETWIILILAVILGFILAITYNLLKVSKYRRKPKESHENIDFVYPSVTRFFDDQTHKYLDKKMMVDHYNIKKYQGHKRRRNRGFVK